MDKLAERKKRRRDPSIEGKRAQAAERRQGSPPATPERLEAAAWVYVGRYAASSAHRERLLLHKGRPSEMQYATDAAGGAAFVRGLILRLKSWGILDDRRYAEGKAMSLRRRGGSGR